MKSEKEIREEIEKLQKIEVRWTDELLGRVAGMVKRRLMWVLED